MEQLNYVGPRELRWLDVPAPKLDSEKAALVRPLAVATCDLDALIIAGASPFQAPFALGHEGVAEVVEIGEGVHSVRPGQRVSVPFQISCGECSACRRGRTANCTEVTPMASYGFGPAVEQWGGFLADTVAVPFADHMLVALPDALEPAALAAASDNLSDAWRAVAPALAAEPGAPTLVIGGAGAGSIGLYAVAVARALGAERVCYADTDERRLQTAGRLGAETVAPPWPKRLGPYPITVDSNGSQNGLELALRSTAPDGTCTSTAIYFGEQPRMPLLEMYTKGISFHTGRVHARAAIPSVLELAANGTLHPELITTRVLSWSDAADALMEPDWTKLVLTRT